MAIRADEPIQSAAEDRLDRNPLAQTISAEIRDLDASKGAVVGILGPWGSGKTSLINLVRDELLKEPHLTILDFNPWIFSGTDDLVDAFFAELTSQMRSEPRLTHVAQNLVQYSKVVAPLKIIPVFGSWISATAETAEAIGELLKQRNTGFKHLRAATETELKKLDAPILIVIDDIDRLTGPEIRDVFKLVRLTASFPNIIYLVALDRLRVEAALNEDGLPGRDYLEKIIQVVFDVPLIPRNLLAEQLIDGLNETISSISPKGLDTARAPVVFNEIIYPLITNMRDVRRYIASSRGTVRDLNDMIDLVDILALEAIRIFLPDLFKQLPSLHNILVPLAPELSIFGDKERIVKPRIEKLLEGAGEKREIIKSVILHLFPAAAEFTDTHRTLNGNQREWRVTKRVAIGEFLSLYLERFVGQHITDFMRAESLLRSLSNEERLNSEIDSYSNDELERLLPLLEEFSDKFTADMAIPTITALFNRLYIFADKPRSLFQFSPRHAIGRISNAMLLTLPKTEAPYSVVLEILAGLDCLSSKFALIDWLSIPAGEGKSFLSSENIDELSTSIAQEICRLASTSLANEPGLLEMIIWCGNKGKLDDTLRQEIRKLPAAGELLKQAVKLQTSQEMFGGGKLRTSKVFFGEALVSIFGSIEALREVVDNCRDAGENTDLQEAVALAEIFMASQD